MLFFCFLIPKRHILVLNHVVWRILHENQFRGLGCGPMEEPGKKKPTKHLWCAISHIRGKETPWGIVTKFYVWVYIWDVFTYATFGEDRLMALGVARGRISHFPIDLRRHRPYNTLARRVMNIILLCKSILLTYLLTKHTTDSWNWRFITFFVSKFFRWMTG